MPARQYGQPADPNREKGGRRGKGSYDKGIAGGGSTPYGAALRDAQEPKTKKEDPSPPSSVVARFHKNDDADSRAEAHHHTLGPQAAQASPGDHTHDGSDSRLLLDGHILTGDKSNPSTMWASILNALVRLGAEDSTT